MGETATATSTDIIELIRYFKSYQGGIINFLLYEVVKNKVDMTLEDGYKYNYNKRLFGEIQRIERAVKHLEILFDVAYKEENKNYYLIHLPMSVAKREQLIRNEI